MNTPPAESNARASFGAGSRATRYLVLLTGVIWTAYIIHSIGRAYVRYPESDAGLLIGRLAVWATACLMTLGVLWILGRFPPARSQFIYFLRAVGVLIVPCAILTLCNDGYLQWLSEAYRQTGRFLRPSELFVTYMNFGWIFVSWSALYAITTGAEDLRLREIQAVNAQVAAREAQLTALRHQLQPHALFNALNAISALIHSRDLERAEATLISFSEFLSHALTHSPRDFGLVRDEIETARLYLSVEAIRFPDRLSVRFDTPDEILDCEAPSLILQPLVENAVTHGLARSLEPVEIVIGGRIDGDSLRLWVLDDARRTGEPRGGHGIGLENVRKRLELLYDQPTALIAASRSPGWRSEVVLPKQRPE